MIRGSHPEPRLPATKVKIESLNLKPKQKFLYLFDYGDQWEFEVEYIKEGFPRENNLPTYHRFKRGSPRTTLRLEEEN